MASRLQPKDAFARLKNSYETVGDTTFPDDVVRGVIAYVDGLEKGQKPSKAGTRKRTRKTAAPKAAGPAPKTDSRMAGETNSPTPTSSTPVGEDSTAGGSTPAKAKGGKSNG